MDTLAAFLAALGSRAAEPGADSPALRAELDAALDAARAAWPDIDVEPAEFAAYLAARVPPDTAVSGALARLRVTDLYLACACARGQPAALAAFERTCMPTIDQALALMRMPPPLIDEVKQILRRLLLVADGRPPRIAEFSGRGDLRGWVRVTGAREALRLLERHRREVPLEAGVLERDVPVGQDPELAYLKELYRGEFKAAFAEAMTRLSDRQKNLLGHHYLDGLTLDQVAALYRVHRATVARWLAAARAELLKHTRKALAGRLRIEPAEMDSIIRLIGSRLDLTLPPLLRAPGPAAAPDD